MTDSSDTPDCSAINPATRLLPDARATRNRVCLHHGDADESGKISLSSSVKRALRLSGFLTLACLSVEDDNGCIRLGGRVSSWYQKQLAQELSMRVVGTLRVCNDIEVAPRF
jgi:osmotically-inducible protein OsmY